MFKKEGVVSSRESSLQALFQAIANGDIKTVLEYAESQPNLFFERSETEVPYLLGRKFAEGTTPLQILYWSVEPMLIPLLEIIEKKGIEFKSKMLKHQVDYCRGSGLLTSTSSQPLYVYEKFYNFEPIISLLKVLEQRQSPADMKSFGEALRDLPTWVSQLMCNVKTAHIYITDILMALNKEQYRKKPYLTDSEMAWSELFTSSNKNFAIHWWEGAMSHDEDFNAHVKLLKEFYSNTFKVTLSAFESLEWKYTKLKNNLFDTSLGTTEEKHVVLHIEEPNALRDFLRLHAKPRAKLATPPYSKDRISVPILHFLRDTFYGNQKQAEARLTDRHTKTQRLLRTSCCFTDYSGRTFNCTAYEYAYWAKDTHMCRMLERHMDEETKAFLLTRINEMERIDDTGKKIGLEYIQDGVTHRSAHFDFTPLKQALKEYVDTYNHYGKYEYIKLREALMVVGKTQSDLPAHVAQEYCRTDRSFNPCPQFNEKELPREKLLYIKRWSYTSESGCWFPLEKSPGLGSVFAFVRGRRDWTLQAYNPRTNDTDGHVSGDDVALDLEAITRLDEQRTAELAQSIKNLSPGAPVQGMTM